MTPGDPVLSRFPIRRLAGAAAPQHHPETSQTVLTKILNDAIRANKAANIVYLNNPKVGCSTIKLNLWTILSPGNPPEGRDVHNIKGSPFETDIRAVRWAAHANIFTFVRNPFVRVVSAYLDKVGGSRKNSAWVTFAERYKLDQFAPLPFDEFIRLISEDAPEDLDRHWRPQHLNILYPFVMPNALGKLERMDSELPEILNTFLGVRPEMKRRDGHATSARESFKDYYTSTETADRVRALYAKDFAYFGYSTDLDAPTAGEDSPPLSAHEHPRLGALSTLHSQPDRARTILTRLSSMIDEAPETKGDAYTRAWVLHTRLSQPVEGARQSQSSLDLVRNGIDDVLAGPEFLRRSAAQIAAGAGAWDLCARIAQASLR